MLSLYMAGLVTFVIGYGAHRVATQVCVGIAAVLTWCLAEAYLL